MPRVIWKGAISFGLVHVPVALYPAAQSIGIDFDWLDRRTMDPVGYKRINKRTGKEIDRKDIVKGIRQQNGEYVVLNEAEIKAAYPKSTQTIEIDAFVDAKEVAVTYFESPYFLAPLAKAEKVYALLREAMLEAGVAGVARLVIHTKEHLAALIPDGAALLLNTLRWPQELRDRGEIELPPAGKHAAGVKERELRMASQLIKDMTAVWKPQDYSENFTDAIHALAAKRVKEGDTETVTPLEPDTAPQDNVLDLTELLKQSLSARKPASHAKRAPLEPAPSRKRAPGARAAAKKSKPGPSTRKAA